MQDNPDPKILIQFYFNIIPSIILFFYSVLHMMCNFELGLYSRMPFYHSNVPINGIVIKIGYKILIKSNIFAELVNGKK